MKGRLMQIEYNRQVDLTSEDGDIVEIECQRELGLPDRFKVYIHVNGETLVRICKLKENQLVIRGPFNVRAAT